MNYKYVWLQHVISKNEDIVKNVFMCSLRLQTNVEFSHQDKHTAHILT